MNVDATPRRSRKLVLFFADVPGYARSFRTHDDLAMAGFIDRFYSLCAGSVASHGGRVVKFIGDACHAVFPDDHGSAAVDCALELQTATRRLGHEAALDVDLGVSLHCGSVVEGQYGGSDHGQYDVIGREMNQTVLMGRGPGLRISEPVYRQLASNRRTPWRKHKLPATYRYSPSSRTPDAEGE